MINDIITALISSAETEKFLKHSSCKKSPKAVSRSAPAEILLLILTVFSFDCVLGAMAVSVESGSFLCVSALLSKETS